MDATTAKIITAIVLIILPIAFSTIPWYTLMRGARSLVPSASRLQVITYLNCFAGGVFLGTLLLHMLPEGSEEFDDYKDQAGKDIDFPLYNLFVAGGFFLVAFVEVLAHQHFTNDGHGHGAELNHQRSRNGYASMDGDYQDHVQSQTHTREHSPVPSDGQGETSQSLSDGKLRALLLVIALSFHTIFDGLAIGLQESVAEVWSVFAAVIIHKSVISFCLGLELFQSNQDKPWKAVVWLVIFTIMSPLGIGIGIGLTTGNINELAKLLVSSILQGLASGTFLYVTFLEILCMYIGHKAETSSVYYLLIAMVGFAMMALAKLLDRD